MPSKTPKQARAMHAAASGNGTIGIPMKVAKEYVQADHLRSKSHKPKKRKSASGGKSSGKSAYGHSTHRKHHGTKKSGTGGAAAGGGG